MATRTALRLAVLISGRGSNMLAIARECAAGRIDARITVVVSDQAGAAGLARAEELGLATATVAADQFRDTGGRFDKQAFEARLTEVIDQHGADVIALAGFMRVLSPRFVKRHAGRLLNIHPSLLPRYKGLHTHERVLAAGDAEHGCSVHYVTDELDGGPVILQARVPVRAGDTAETLSARVQQCEHIIYPRVIQWLAAGRLALQAGRPVLDGLPLDAALQESA